MEVRRSGLWAPGCNNDSNDRLFSEKYTVKDYISETAEGEGLVGL